MIADDPNALIGPRDGLKSSSIVRCILVQALPNAANFISGYFTGGPHSQSVMRTCLEIDAAIASLLLSATMKKTTMANTDRDKGEWSNS